MKQILNFLKLIFSRLFIVALLVVLQVFIIVYFAFYLTNSYLYFQIASSVIGIIVFITIINKKINPEHKLMWAFLMLLFPIFATTLYVLLFLNHPSKKQLKKYYNFDPRLIEKDLKYNNLVYKIANEYQGQIKYLENTTSLYASKNNKTTFLSDGNAFYNSLKKDIIEAKEFIFMEYFIIKPGLMWNSILSILVEKVKEGVEVRLIYDDVGSAKYVKGNYYKYLNKLGIKCVKFNKLIPFVVSYHNNRDHRKITIIDGKIAYTGGINFGDEYINLYNEFGYWKDNAVKIEGESVDNFTILFLQNYSIANKKCEDCFPYLNKDHSHIENDELVFPYGTGPKIYYENMAVDVFLNLINQSKETIEISSPYLILDYSFTNALIAAKKRGVDVKILIPNKPDKLFIYWFTKSNVIELLNNDINVYTYTPGFNHAKLILIDKKLSYIGTTNLDFRSLIHHYECGAWLYNCSCIKDIDKSFTADFKESKKLQKGDVKMNIISRLLVSFLNIFKSLL